MSKADTVTYKTQSFYAGLLTEPILDLIQYISKDSDSSVNVYTSIHSVAANASDVNVPIDEDDNTKITFLYATAGVGTDFITVKTNGDTDSRAVKPIRVISGKLSSLTVSSSDTSNTNYLGIVRIVASDNTNVILKEEKE